MCITTRHFLGCPGGWRLRQQRSAGRAVPTPNDPLILEHTSDRSGTQAHTVGDLIDRLAVLIQADDRGGHLLRFRTAARGTSFLLDQSSDPTPLHLATAPREGSRVDGKGLAHFAHARQFRFHQLHGRETVLDFVLDREPVEPNLIHEHRPQAQHILKPDPAIDGHGPFGQRLLPAEILLPVASVHRCSLPRSEPSCRH